MLLTEARYMWHDRSCPWGKKTPPATDNDGGLAKELPNRDRDPLSGIVPALLLGIWVERAVRNGRIRRMHSLEEFLFREHIA